MAPLFEGGILAGALAIAATAWRTLENFVTGKGDKPDDSGKGKDVKASDGN